MFITFEGIEGTGKTTQITLLADYLKSINYNVLVTKEPGGTEFGQIIRKIILDPNTKFKHNHTELLLFFADRAEHVEKVILPALKEKKIVLCDRYIDSTYAYQYEGRGISIEYIKFLDKMINLYPDLTILFDCNPSIGLSRASKRAALDRFEQEELSFHEKVRQGFLNQAKEFPNRINVISIENKSIESISSEIKSIFNITIL